MRKVVAALLMAIVLGCGLAATPAEARRGFWPGFAVGTGTGLIVSPILVPR